MGPKLEVTIFNAFPLNFFPASYVLVADRNIQAVHLGRWSACMPFVFDYRKNKSTEIIKATIKDTGQSAN